MSGRFGDSFSVSQELEMNQLRKKVKNARITYRNAEVAYIEALFPRKGVKDAEVVYDRFKEMKNAEVVYRQAKVVLRNQWIFGRLGIVKIPLGPGRAHYEFVGVGGKDKEERPSL